MAHVVRPLILWPRWRRPHSTGARLVSLHSSSSRTVGSFPYSALFSNSCSEVHSRSRALKLRDVNSLSDAGSESNDETSEGGETNKSRNERKREARRAVRWGMELAKFSASQIKRILRVADLEEEVFDALMLVKKLGPDVREGKRRQFNYIGRLLREAEPQIMDELIQATKDGDQSMFPALSESEKVVADVDEEDNKDEETADEDEEESMDINVVTRWYNGLINKDISITNEIYSLREVEFDRQELRKLVRRIHTTLEQEASLDENGKSEVFATNARKSLTRFLHGLAKQLPAA